MFKGLNYAGLKSFYQRLKVWLSDNFVSKSDLGDISTLKSTVETLNSETADGTMLDTLRLCAPQTNDSGYGSQAGAITKILVNLDGKGTPSDWIGGWNLHPHAVSFRFVSPMHVQYDEQLKEPDDVGGVMVKVLPVSTEEAGLMPKLSNSTITIGDKTVPPTMQLMTGDGHWRGLHLSFYNGQLMITFGNANQTSAGVIYVKIPDATQSASGLMSKTDKKALEQLESWATYNGDSHPEFFDLLVSNSTVALQFYDMYGRGFDYTEIGQATTTKAGVMSAEDKKALESLKKYEPITDMSTLKDMFLGGGTIENLFSTNRGGLGNGSIYMLSARPLYIPADLYEVLFVINGISEGSEYYLSREYQDYNYNTPLGAPLGTPDPVTGFEFPLYFSLILQANSAYAVRWEVQLLS